MSESITFLEENKVLSLCPEFTKLTKVGCINQDINLLSFVRDSGGILNCWCLLLRLPLSCIVQSELLIRRLGRESIVNFKGIVSYCIALFHFDFFSF